MCFAPSFFLNTPSNCLFIISDYDIKIKVKNNLLHSFIISDYDRRTIFYIPLLWKVNDVLHSFIISDYDQSKEQSSTFLYYFRL